MNREKELEKIRKSYEALAAQNPELAGQMLLIESVLGLREQVGLMADYYSRHLELLEEANAIGKAIVEKL